MSHAPAANRKPADSSLVDFLWLELTNRCNLRCVHCYAESGPETGTSDLLAFDDYVRVLDEAHRLGCRRVQFIGGEPTLNRNLERLILHASGSGFEFIEVFTNLTRLSESLLTMFVKKKIHIATSVYSNDSNVHDSITGKSGSFFATTRNIDRVLKAGLTLRLAFIEMTENLGHAEQTFAFFRERGVHHIRHDTIRKFGRGNDAPSCEMGDLCGECAGKTLCVGPDGVVSPCIMSRSWGVGNVLDLSLSELVAGPALKRTRAEIGQATAQKRIAWQQHNAAVSGTTHTVNNVCDPWSQCPPCPPNTICNPHNCRPWK